MKTIIINGQEYKFEAVYATKRAINGNIGVVVQLQVFKDGIQLDNKDLKGYVAEKLEEYIVQLLR